MGKEDTPDSKPKARKSKTVKKVGKKKTSAAAAAPTNTTNASYDMEEEPLEQGDDAVDLISQKLAASNPTSRQRRNQSSAPNPTQSPARAVSGSSVSTATTRSAGSVSQFSKSRAASMDGSVIGAVSVAGIGASSAHSVENDEHHDDDIEYQDDVDDSVPTPPEPAFAASVTAESVTATAVAREDLENEVRQQIISEAMEAKVVPIDATVTLVHDDQEKTKSSERSKSSRTTVLLMAVLCCMVILVGVIVAVFIAMKKDNNSGSSGNQLQAGSPTSVPTSAPTTAGGVLGPTLPGSTGSPLRDVLAQVSPDVLTVGSAQARAFTWLVDHSYNPSSSLLLETFALVTLYFATDGNNWSQKDHWLNDDVGICEWYPGRLCTEPSGPTSGAGRRLADDAIYALDLSGNNLQGSIPAEIHLLNDLATLALYDNDGLTGTIPTEVGRMTSLVGLLLGGTTLTGEIPTELGDISTLKSLDLAYCTDIEGSIPEELTNIQELVLLNLEGIGLTGTLPTFTRSPHEVLLAHNELSGTIPETGWVEVQTIDLSYNELTGTVPAKFFQNWDNGLEILRLEGNLLTGDVPSAVCNSFEQAVQQDYEFSVDCNGDDTVCPCCTLCCTDGENCHEPSV